METSFGLAYFPKLVARNMPETFLAAAKAATNGQVMGEFLQSQGPFEKADGQDHRQCRRQRPLAAAEPPAAAHACPLPS